ncbi:outer membrane beta-barrel protein [Aliiglaciecola lipolytica]|uniref:Outer membrane protein beta-barrel domain-containing protein n=1 Tax=Aliiglaciecola lipolytica E3 TaxID=1127673 RepID=K6YA92_9ALTE|nr:outer membrane beta-barrel protein [Aliiglaciecola lipolytica]GAC15112.1 hypothetical protein GLIP_2486 [Aliiglaciecola lipolytica E3]
MKLSRCLFLVTLLFVSGHAVATDDMYGSAIVGYAKTGFDSNNTNSATYKLAVGYQFHEKWYAEFGYHKLSDQSLVETLPTTMDDLNNTDFGLNANALGFSVLGKAGSNYGELFYRLGVLNVDIEGQSVTSADSCEFGVAAPFTLESGENYTLCEYDEGIAAAQIGIGFDFYIGVNLMLRTEIEHIRGQHGFEHNAAYVGFRYNFR